MTIGVVIHAGDLANSKGLSLVEKYVYATYVVEMGYEYQEILDPSKTWNIQGLYRMLPKDPDQQIDRVMKSAASQGIESVMIRLVEFPLKEQGDYAFKAAEAIKKYQNISVCAPINYFGVGDSITHRLLGFLNHSVTVVPIIRLSTNEAVITQLQGALVAIRKMGTGFTVIPCLQIVGGETLTDEQIDIFCMKVLAVSNKLYLWSLGTIINNPIVDRIITFMNTTYIEPIEQSKPEIIEDLSKLQVEPRYAGKTGRVAVPDLSVRKDCSLSAKIIGTMQVGEEVKISELIWPNPDLCFAHLDNGYWAVQHWGGVDYIITD